MLTTANTHTHTHKNPCHLTGRMEISKEEILGSKRSIHDLLQALKGESVSSVFSPDGTLISGRKENEEIEVS